MMSLQPEMEMVARGLENHLSLDQRELILESLINVCGEETQRSFVEALGLVCPFSTSIFKSSVVLYSCLN